MKKKSARIVCLGGGIGTVNLLKGLKNLYDISVVVSTADEGGSGGRLRRLFNMLPPGDFVSCIAALCSDKNISRLLTYRFPGNRYGKDRDLAGHKLGNLILAALFNIHGNFENALSKMEEVFNVNAHIFPATNEKTKIFAKTTENKIIYGEEKIDLGKYAGERILKKLFLTPKNASSPKEIIDNIMTADGIIAGPGDLYTTILPVLMAKDIRKALQESACKKFFIVNIANKPFETKGYSALNYIEAIEKHLDFNPFDTVIVNDNFSVKIPSAYHYSYVRFDSIRTGVKLLKADLVDKNFPLYHDSRKLAKIIKAAV